MVAMAQGTDKSAPRQEKEARKRTQQSDFARTNAGEQGVDSLRIGREGGLGLAVATGGSAGVVVIGSAWRCTTFFRPVAACYSLSRKGSPFSRNEPSAFSQYKRLGTLRVSTRDPFSLKTALDSRSLSLARGLRRGCPRDDLEGEPAGFAISADNHPVAGIQGSREDHAGQLVVHPPLYRTPQGPRPELGVEALFGYQPDRPFGELDLYTLGPQAPRRTVEQKASDLAYLLLAEGAEDDHLVYAVDELGAQGVFEDLHHVVLELLEGLITPGVRLYPLCAHVGGHDDHRLLEVHRPALRVCQTSVVEDLQKDIEDVGVSLLYLVQEQDAVGTAPDTLGELACLLVADVAGRGPNQAAHRVPLLELAHVDANHGRLLAEEGFGQRAGELGLSNARWPEEQEAAYRAIRIGESRASPPHRFGDCL